MASSDESSLSRPGPPAAMRPTFISRANDEDEEDNLEEIAATETAVENVGGRPEEDPVECSERSLVGEVNAADCQPPFDDGDDNESLVASELLDHSIASLSESESRSCGSSRRSSSAGGGGRKDQQSRRGKATTAAKDDLLLSQQGSAHTTTSINNASMSSSLDPSHSGWSLSGRGADHGPSPDSHNPLDDSVGYLPGRFSLFQQQSLDEALLEVPAEEPLDADAQYHALNFVAEHRIFVKAALDLLAERDRQAPELGMMDPIVIKSGSLKKASHLMNGVWKVKFVEIRRGMFSYYENQTVGGGSSATSSFTSAAASFASSSSQHHHKNKDDSHGGSNKGGPFGSGSGAGIGGSGALLRKDVPLEASTCSCRAVRFHEKARNFTPTGAIFELSVSGSSKRLWMAKTRADRQLWMQAIHQAMVGGSLTRGDQASTSEHRGATSPYKGDLRTYGKAQNALRAAKTRLDYLTGLRLLSDRSLKVPVKWIAKQQSTSSGTSSSEPSSNAAFREETVDVSVEQLWRDMQRDSVRINGELFRGDAGHGPERIVGALVREILCLGRHDGESGGGRGSASDLPESQALAYARDILLSGNRTRSGGDSYFCVNTLCSNPDLVVVTPSGKEAEPVIIDVVEDESDVRVIEKSGWIKTRSKSQKEWVKLFFVLSEGTLSFYESALPRPHRLRGQIVLTDSAVSISKLDNEFVMKIFKEGSGRERWMAFASEDRLLDWTYALECSSKLQNSAAVANRKPSRFMGSSHKSEASDAVPTKVDVLFLAEQSTKEHAISLGLDDELVENRLALFAKRAASSMVISIRACTEYKICTLDPEGEEQLDTWATIRAHFLQSFRLTGGANGRILRGEEIVRVSVADCIDPAAALDPSTDIVATAEDPSSPNRRSQNRRIFRRFSTSEEVEEILKTPSVE